MNYYYDEHGFTIACKEYPLKDFIKDLKNKSSYLSLSLNNKIMILKFTFW